jgi:hypothetical protein
VTKNILCKPLSGDFHVQFIEQRPSYRAGFALYITLNAMGPLFSAFVLVSGSVVLSAIVFAVARFFQPTSVAIRIALVFVVGSAVGGVASVVGLASFVGATLSESWQVIAYLLSLVAGALFGGTLLLVLCIKHRVLTLQSTRPA